MFLRLPLTAIVAVLAVCGPLDPAAAQTYPNRPITLVVPFAAGGSPDIIARALGEELSAALGQNVVIENRGGAGGSLGTAIAGRATPDGHTMLFTLSSHSINPVIYQKLPFDTERDLRGVTLIGALPQALAAHPSAPANTLREFLQQTKGGDARSRTYASGGVGSPGHFAAAYLESLAGNVPKEPR